MTGTCLYHVIPSWLALILVQIYPRIQRTFTDVQYRTLSGVLRGCHLIPVPRDVSPFLVPSHSENALSSLQRLVLQCIGGVVTSDDIMRPKDDQSEDNMAEVGVAVPPAVVELLGLILHKFITTYVHEVQFVI